MAPLIVAIPLFAFSVFSRAGLHVVDFASVIGFLGISAAIGAFIRPENERIFLGTRLALIVSAVLFLIASRPLGGATVSSIPFAVLVIWRAKKGVGSLRDRLSS
jgi:hypothetical protein